MQENSFHTVTHIDQMHAEPNKGGLYKNQSIDSTDRRSREGTCYFTNLYYFPIEKYLNN